MVGAARPFVARAVLAAVLLAFAAAALARLNPFCLFEPDSAEYLFTARALAQLEGLRGVFRPPGLPILLAPLSAVRPYDVEAAKLVVLATGLLALWLLFRYASSVGSGATGAVVAAGLTAASPFTLLHATEIVSELPFLAAALGALLLVRGWPDHAPRRVVAAGATLLATAALLRTVGLALLVALAIWALWTRRRPWLIAVVAASGPTVAWMWHCSRTGAPTYLGALADAVQRLGWQGYLAAAGRQGTWYLGRLPGLILPGLSDTRPVYERVLLDSAPGPGFPAAVCALAALLVMIAAVAGMWSGRRSGGGIAAVFGVAYLGVLAVYPPKHERLAWPLVPFVWTWAAVAVAHWMSRRKPRGPGVARAASAVLAASVVAVMALESAGSWAMVRANRAWAGDREQFHERRLPPMYYVDWQEAGRWISAETPAHARVLTRHSDVGFTSRRYQESMRFEELAPRQWRGALAAMPARALVVQNVRCGEGIRWQMFDADPSYRYLARHERDGATVFEVSPNRDGTVSLESPRLSRQIAVCREAVTTHPDRDDLRRRLADLLGEAGRAQEGLVILRTLLYRPAARAEVWLTQGDLLLDLDRAEEAAAAFARGATSPGAEWLGNSLARGRRLAADSIAQRSLPAIERARRLAREGLDRLQALDPRAAAEAIARAENLAPDDPEVLAAHASLARRAGRNAESRAIFARLAAGGDRAAATMLAELEQETALESGTGGSEPGEWLRVARFQVGDGVPGRAVVTLERAAERFPEERAVLSALAELYLFFGLAERAEPIFVALAARDGSNVAAARGLARCREQLRPVDY